MTAHSGKRQVGFCVIACVIAGIVVLCGAVQPAEAQLAIERVEPTEGLPGDSFVVHGKDLKTKGIEFFLGMEQIRPTEWTQSRARFVVPKNARSGPVIAEVNGAYATSAGLFQVYRSPTISSIPKMAGVPGTIIVRGKNLDAVESWYFGELDLEVDPTYERNNASQVRLLVREDTIGRHRLSAHSQRKVVRSKTTLTLAVAPQIYAVRFSRPGGAGKTTCVVMGQHFDERTRFYLGSRALDVVDVGEDYAVLETSVRIQKRNYNFSARQGRFRGNIYKLDGAANGYTFTPKELQTLIAAGSVPGHSYNVYNVVLDLDQMREQLSLSAVQYQKLGRDAAKNKRKTKKVDTVTQQVAENLLRLAAAQYQVCKQMNPGQHDGDSNKDLGRLLEQLAQESQKLVDSVYLPMVSSLDAETSSRHRQSPLLDRPLSLVWKNMEANLAACDEKYYGNYSAREIVETEFQALQRRL